MFPRVRAHTTKDLFRFEDMQWVFHPEELGEHKPGRIKRAALSLQNPCFMFFCFLIRPRLYASEGSVEAARALLQPSARAPLGALGGLLVLVFVCVFVLLLVLLVLLVLVVVMVVVVVVVEVVAAGLAGGGRRLGG